MVSVAAFDPGDLGSNSGWWLSQIQIKIELSCSTPASTLTLQWGISF